MPCAHARQTRFIRDPETGRLDPVVICPACGAALEPDGWDLQFADVIGPLCEDEPCNQLPFSVLRNSSV